MIKIAIIDDDPNCIRHLTELLEQYTRETGTLFQIKGFSNAEQFLYNYKPYFDIAFMDVDLPGDNGIKATHKLRAFDPKIILFFGTYLAQFAIEGYKVNAKDYFVKPIKYYDLKMDLDQVCPALESDSNKPMLNVYVNNGVKRVALKDLCYIETQGHTLIYHLRDEVIEARGSSLSSIEKKLSEYGFICCNASFLVNLQYCESISGDNLKINGDEIKITRSKKKEFVKTLADYFSQNGINEKRI